MCAEKARKSMPLVTSQGQIRLFFFIKTEIQNETIFVMNFDVPNYILKSM